MFTWCFLFAGRTTSGDMLPCSCRGVDRFGGQTSGRACGRLLRETSNSGARSWRVSRGLTPSGRVFTWWFLLRGGPLRGSCVHVVVPVAGGPSSDLRSRVRPLLRETSNATARRWRVSRGLTPSGRVFTRWFLWTDGRVDRERIRGRCQQRSDPKWSCFRGGSCIWRSLPRVAFGTPTKTPRGHGRAVPQGARREPRRDRRSESSAPCASSASAPSRSTPRRIAARSTCGGPTRHA